MKGWVKTICDENSPVIVSKPGCLFLSNYNKSHKFKKNYIWD